nr:abscisic acid 8'-hydroxylase 4-like [Ipomoea batatas]
MEKYGMVFYVFIILVLSVFSYILSATRNKKHKLPPGSMGWPYIGETLQLYSQDPNIFFSHKHTRYGEIFKSRMLGYPCVMLASPEAARFVLVTHANLFKPTYPKSKEDLIGPAALFFHQGDYHLRLRKVVQRCFSPEAIRNFVADIEDIAVSALDSWADGQVVNTFREMKKFSFEVGIMAIFGHLEDHHKEELKRNYCIVEKGYNSFPTSFPGSSYSNALKARKMLSKILCKIISERKEKKTTAENGLLSCFLSSQNENNNGISLTENQIADNIIGVLFAAQDTTASALIWIIKYLHDNPKLLESVKAEQKAICKQLKVEETRHLTWRNTREMPITHKVVLETLRKSSIISFTFREAVEDVEYKGYLIPKGWKVMPLFRNIHQNPDFFSDPHTFDPSRFEKAPKPNTFMPFGSGVHACPGNELAKLEMLIITHHLVTKFRWEVVGPESGIQYGPFPVPIHGLPARFWRQSDNNNIINQQQ